jgi:hypothetical protein
MTPPPADLAFSAALADGERWALEVAEDNPGHWSGHAGVAALMANYSRLQRIEQAAANYVYTDAGDPAIADRYVELEAALNGDES